MKTAIAALPASAIAVPLRTNIPAPIIAPRLTAVANRGLMPGCFCMVKIPNTYL